MKLKESIFLRDNKKHLKKIIDELSKEYEYVSILGTDVKGVVYRVLTSGIAVSPSPTVERGFVIRVMDKGIVSEYSFNNLDIEKIIEKVKYVVEEDRKNFSVKDKDVIYPRLPENQALEASYISEVENLPEDDDAKEIIEVLSKNNKEVFDKYDEIVFMGTGLEVTQVNKMFLTNNRDLYQSYAYSNTMCYAVSSNGELTKYDYMSKSLFGGSEILKENKELVEEAAKRAIELLDSSKVVPGEYDIICDPDFTGLIAHEAFGHGAEMDMFVKDRAKGMEYVNKRVASDKVFMHDGAKSYAEVSSYLFDDEGTLGTDTLIIDKGILKTGMCDELSAILLGGKSTGNGKRESYKRKSYTRMTNTFFEGGDDKLEDMIASVENGYLLEGLFSGMEDPKNWGIQCVASKGREIKDGKLTGKIISPVILTGYVPDLLNSISMVSDGIELSGSGFCGKGWKEWVKTSTGGSYIKARGKLS